MNVEKLYDLYSNNLSSIINSSMLATISNRSYDIHGYNLINRILIYIQNKYSTSLKGEEAWSCVGRKVKDKASPIWVIENIVKVTYIDPETNEIIDDIGMNPKEIEDAIKYGTIIQKQNIEGLKCLPIYNIKDTIIFDSEIYKEFSKYEHQNIKLSALFNATISEFGFTFSKSDIESSYDLASNSIFIGNEDLYTKIGVIADAIMHKTEIYDAIDELSETYNVSDKVILKMIDLSRIMMTESLTSFCDKSHDVDQSVFSDLDSLNISDPNEIECFMQILSTVYDIIEGLIAELNPSIQDISELKIRKAAELLNILEANDAIMRYRG